MKYLVGGIPDWKTEPICLSFTGSSWKRCEVETWCLFRYFTSLLQILHSVATAFPKIPTESVHLDPKCWENPTMFNPYRHIDENGKLITNQGNFYPFGAGRRVCAGEPLAKVELFLFLSWMLQEFTFIAEEDGRPSPGLRQIEIKVCSNERVHHTNLLVIFFSGLLPTLFALASIFAI